MQACLFDPRLSSTMTVSADQLNVRWSQEISPQVEPDKVSLCRAEVMNLSGIDMLTWPQVEPNSTIKVQEITGRWGILCFMKADMAYGATTTEGLFAECVPRPTWLFFHSKIFEMSAAM